MSDDRTEATGDSASTHSGSGVEPAVEGQALQGRSGTGEQRRWKGYVDSDGCLLTHRIVFRDDEEARQSGYEPLEVVPLSALQEAERKRDKLLAIKVADTGRARDSVPRLPLIESLHRSHRERDQAQAEVQELRKVLDALAERAEEVKWDEIHDGLRDAVADARAALSEPDTPTHVREDE